jgi:hypothetical protein
MANSLRPAAASFALLRIQRESALAKRTGSLYSRTLGTGYGPCFINGFIQKDGVRRPGASFSPGPALNDPMVSPVEALSVYPV